MTCPPSCPECEDPDTEQTPLGLWCFSCGDYVDIKTKTDLDPKTKTEEP